MKTNYFKVINRETREEQIFNSEEFKRFFYCFYDEQTKKVKYINNMRDYAIHCIKEDGDEWILNLAISFFGVGLVICITKIIMLYVV
tara:strand:- start:126 stop:386 length:261 start_codon:yes stop_codon:yes gene_type:complete